MDGTHSRKVILWLSSIVFLLSSSLARAETRAKREQALSTHDHIQNVLENRDPRSLWLLLTRSGIFAIPGLLSDAQGSSSARLGSDASTAVVQPDRVTVRSCRALIEGMDSEIEERFEKLFETTSERSRREIREPLQQLKDEFYKWKMEQLLVSLGVPRDWEEENQRKIEEFRKAHPKGIVRKTKYYHVLSTAGKEVTRELARSMDLVAGRVYRRIFSFGEEIPHRYIIRFWKNRKEYEEAGGSRGSVAFFSPATKELVGYNTRSEYGLSHVNPYQTMFHEGWHQYFDYYIPGAPRWFDEGFAEVIAATRIEGSRVIRQRYRERRSQVVTKACARDELIPLQSLITMNHADFYEQSQLAYAQAWSFVYFLVTFKHKNKKLEKKVRNLYKDYFQELQNGASAREAFDRAFETVDLRKLETAWKKAIPRQSPRR